MGIKGSSLRALMWLTRVFGLWFMRLVAWIITGGYFLFRPRRVRAGMDLYRAVFPGRTEPFYRYCVWKQFTGFAAAYCDRLNLDTGGNIEYKEAGEQGLKGLAESGRGGIILTSHIGNWEVGARLFRRFGYRMMLLMGERESKEVARYQREDMKAEGLEVLVTSPEEEDPFGALDALEFIRAGGFVAIAGDLVWSDQARRVEVRLFGREVMLPAAPHLMALLFKAPLFSVFTFRTNRNEYLFEVSGPRWVRSPSRAERQAAVEDSARIYAKELEGAVRRFPWQWYVFEPLFTLEKNREREGERNGKGSS